MGDSVIEGKGHSVIIIGAGAAGLMAAKELSEAGMTVTVLEAASLPGGRMQTLKTEGFSVPVEAGAEFVHGSLPLTLGLLQEGGIEFTPIAGDMKSVRGGQWIEDDALSQHWELLMKHMHEVKEDVTVDKFLDQYFSGSEYGDLRKSVRRFAEGFDLADPARASVMALKEEWAQEEEEQYRVTGGYLHLVNYLVDCCREEDVAFYFSQHVTEVNWKEGEVVVNTSKQSFTAERLLVTVSVGVMRDRSIRFDPEPTLHLDAFNRIGFGSVIKFLFEFRDNFWNDKLPDGGFILSDEQIPTWWTQAPDSTLLTGWVGGPSAAELNKLEESVLLDKALKSLSSIFGTMPDLLRSSLVRHRVIQWDNDPHIAGGYSYNFPDSAEARDLLRESLQHTIYFAGEGLYTGNAPGTVEAALQTGVQAASHILAALHVE